MVPTRLLVVDDDRAVRESLRRALTLEGYDVELAEDGVDGLARFAGASPDAVVLDVAMPNVDGIEMCRRLRSDGSAYDRGKYILIWKRIADRWLIHRDMFNSALPRSHSYSASLA